MKNTIWRNNNIDATSDDDVDVFDQKKVARTSHPFNFLVLCTTYYDMLMYLLCTKIFNTVNTVGYEYTQKYALAWVEKNA